MPDGPTITVHGDGHIIPIPITGVTPITATTIPGMDHPGDGAGITDGVLPGAGDGAVIPVTIPDIIPADGAGAGRNLHQPHIVRVLPAIIARHRVRVRRVITVRRPETHAILPVPQAQLLLRARAIILRSTPAAIMAAVPRDETLTSAPRATAATTTPLPAAITTRVRLRVTHVRRITTTATRVLHTTATRHAAAITPDLTAPAAVVAAAAAVAVTGAAENPFPKPKLNVSII